MSKLCLMPEALSAPAVPETARAAVLLSEEEQQIVRGCQRGERAAMQTLYQRYVCRVRTLVARIVGSADVDELTQEIFLKALRGIAGFRGESQLGTWMYRLAVNAALSYATRDQARLRRQADETVLAFLPADGAREGDPLLAARLRRAMDALPAGYRAVLVLHDIEGLQHEEIAAILGVRTGTSKSQLHKARARMREILGEP